MKYLTERGLYYYFLIREIADSGVEVWYSVARIFGIDSEMTDKYAALLGNEVLDELSTVGDIDLYKNYIGGYFNAETQFGKDECERGILDIKFLALHRAQAMFDEVKNKVNRLRLLANFYEQDRVAAVLYAMQLSISSSDKECHAFAVDILKRELNENGNSDAGLILLNIEDEDKSCIVDRLRCLSDILIRPEISLYLAERYGGSNIILKNRHTIGF